MAHAAAWAVAAAAAATGGEAAGRPTITWPIPAAAWRVPIGRGERGIPVGGIGAGSIMVNAGGSFGPWHFRAGSPEEERRLAGAAFHFYEKPEGGQGRATTLTASRQMPAWAALPPNSGFYHALYPKGWFTYRCFAADLSLKFFSPVIRGNVRETSLPVALFLFEVANPGEEPLEVGLLFSFPNAAGHTGDLRSGFANSVHSDPEAKVAAVVLDARYEHNDPVAEDTEWCIAVRAEGEGEVSHVSSWNAMANGGDLLREFAADGRLPDRALDATQSAAAVAFTVRLAPGATASVPFVLSWDFPRARAGSSLWWRRYTEHAGREGDNAFPIAREALLEHAAWEAAIDAWTRPILDEEAYPEWLKQAALNELYFMSHGGVLWEAGCITEPREFKGLHSEDHKYFALASSAQPYCEPLHLRRPLRLWPAIERDVLVAYADFILEAPGAAVHDLGTPADNPLFAYNAWPDLPADAVDLPALFILQAHGYYRATGDRAFLDQVWPACKKCYQALRSASDGGLPRHRGDDTVAAPCPVQGVSLLCGGLHVAALEALEALAAVRQDPLAADLARLVPQARRSLDQQLWRPQAGHYATDTGSEQPDDLAAFALVPVGYAQAQGLPPILPQERLRQHLHQVFLHCVKPLRDYTGDGVGDVGAMNVAGPEGAPPRGGRAREVSVATTYGLAATMYRVGLAAGDEELMARALKTAHGAYYQTWSVAPDKPVWAFNTPQAWNAQNPARARAPRTIEARAVWELLLAIKDPFAQPAARE
ncbi:MAG: GH116 family glycosyl-hydrolase [Candidatus Brocadiia bacterium]